MYRHLNLLALAFLILMSGCQPAAAAVPTAEAATVTPTAPAPGTTEVPTGTASAPATASAAPVWMQYRDLRYGYGIAIPCYWSINPTPPDGTFAAMTARSYSDDFFKANSERGEWMQGVIPAGAYKMDVIVVEDIDPSLSLEEAIRYFYKTYVNEQELLSVEETSLGRHQGAVATAQGGLQGGETTRTVFFPLSAGRLVLFAFLPNAALEAADIQPMLGSFTTSPDEPVTLPLRAPSGPPDGDPVSCT